MFEVGRRSLRHLRWAGKAVAAGGCQAASAGHESRGSLAHCARSACSVCREAEELASAAAAAGADAEAVEAALVLTGGNWQAAIDALQSPQEYSAPAGSAATTEVGA